MNKKIFNIAFTMGATHVNRLYLQRIAFTMAEILLSLTIIGVVAAITLPSLTGNINERTWRTQRKTLHARMAQALALMGNINGYGQYVGTYTDGRASVITDTAAIAFVTNGLSKVLKLNNICDTEHLQDCGIASQYTGFQTNSKYNFPKSLYELNSTISRSENPQNHINTKVAAFETANGESIALFYNPYCASEDMLFVGAPLSDNYIPIYVNPYVCANFVFDLNGKKGPNTFGKDAWFMTALYSDKLDVIMLEPEKLALTTNDNFMQCKNYCASINARNATVEEGISYFYNTKFAPSLGFLKYDSKFSRALPYTPNNTDDISLFIYKTTGYLRVYMAAGACSCIYTDGR